jgi:hypothetical protein
MSERFMGWMFDLWAELGGNANVISCWCQENSFGKSTNFEFDGLTAS